MFSMLNNLTSGNWLYIIATACYYVIGICLFLLFYEIYKLQQIENFQLEKANNTLLRLEANIEMARLEKYVTTGTSYHIKLPKKKVVKKKVSKRK
jgi:hypothetical protein